MLNTHVLFPTHTMTKTWLVLTQNYMEKDTQISEFFKLFFPIVTLNIDSKYFIYE